MIVSEIRYDQIKDRIDAEFYKPEFVHFEQKLLELSSTTLGDLLSKIVRDPMGYGFDYVAKGIPYYRVDDLQNPFLGDDRTAFISRENHKRLQKTMLKSGDIIMAVRGSTIGRLGLYFGKDNEGNISPNVIILRPKKRELSAYIAVYLLAEIGKAQIERATAGTGQPTITVPYMKNIKIPIPPLSLSNRMESIVRKAYKKRQESNTKYRAAESLLNETLGIEQFKFEQNKAFETNFDDVKQTMRFDAEYYQPKYKQLKDFISKSVYRVEKLREIVRISNKKIDPSQEPTKPFNYIELANINPSTGEIEGYSQIIGHEAPSRARMVIKSGDVLVASLSGSLDNVGLVPDELDGAIASTGFFVIRSENFLSEFLFLLFRSNLMKLQLEEKTAGAIMSAVPKATFGDLLIPLVQIEKQKPICSLIKESFKLRKEAKGLLNKAKKEIEDFIEYQEKYHVSQKKTDKIF